jgi:ubiquinone/menaquinone biosynthesis C-methylase UbiE
MENNSSWQKVSKWYNKTVGDEGLYYHQHVIMPNLKRILNLKENESLLDLACGQGILERNMDKNIEYVGVDLASNLIREANEIKINPKHKFIIADVSKDYRLTKLILILGQLFWHCKILKKNLQLLEILPNI